MKMKNINLILNAFTSYSFIILSLISVILIVTSFFIPPVGVIDSSVMTAVGELFAFAALGTVIKALDKGVDAEIIHKDTTIKLTNDEE